MARRPAAWAVATVVAVGMALAPGSVIGADELLVGTTTPSTGLRIVDLNGTVLGPPIPDLQSGSWSPDGTRIIGRAGNDVVVVDADGSHRSVVASGWRAPVFSPEGRRWAGWRNTLSGLPEIGIGAVSGGPVDVVPNLPPGLSVSDGFAEPAWSSRNEIALAFFSDPSSTDPFSTLEIGLIRPDGTGFRSVLTLPKPAMPLTDDITFDLPRSFAFSPDGATLALGRYISLGRTSGQSADPFHYDFRITTLAVEAGGVAGDRSVGTGLGNGAIAVTGVFPVGMSFAPDGERLAVAGADGDATKLLVYRLADGSTSPIAARTVRSPGTVAWRPGDADGDALPDAWETRGVDVDGDGVVDLDLPAMGADPLHKDVFVEVDAMASHELEQAAIDRVVDAFAQAPVLNPDGTTGIALHVDNGPASVMNPRTGARWGARSGHDILSHVDVLGTVGAGGYDWGDFDALRTANFAEEREPAFHYMISAHGHDGTRSGIARTIPGSDFQVTLGAGCQQATGIDCTLDADAQAGTFMHELGHNLGLRHGGDDERLAKPTYISVMNYDFQLTGLLRDDLTTRTDYARFGLALNEAALDETRGFGALPGSAAARFLTMGRCPSGAQTMWPLQRGPVNFDCDGTTGGVVSSDVNRDGEITAFVPFEDWPNLVFRGGNVGALGAPVGPPVTPRMEPPLSELLASRDTIKAYMPTTTTLAGCSGVPDGATFASILCRLQALRDATAAATALGDLRTKLDQSLGQAIHRATAARDFCSRSDAKHAKSRLKQVGRQLVQFSHRLRGPKARKTAPLEVRQPRASEGDAIKGDAGMLRQRLSCPADGAAAG